MAYSLESRTTASPDRAASTASYVGAFINLDRSPQRRAEMEGQLAELGIADRYVRFPAIDGSKLAKRVELAARARDLRRELDALSP